MQSQQSKPKILIIGEDVSGGLAKTFCRSFESLGCAALIFDDRKAYSDTSFLQRSRYISHFFWRFLAGRLQKNILKEVLNERPNLILVFKGWLIHPKTIKTIKKVLPSIIIFNYNPDNPFNNWAHGNSNSWIINAIRFYDVYLIWGRFLIKKLLSAGAKRVEYLPFAYDPKLHYRIDVVDGRERNYYESDVAFIGTYDKERVLA